jgi:hypothetical protein
MNGLLFSRRLSQIVAIGLCLGIWSPAARAQEAIAAEEHDREKVAPDAKTNPAKASDPQPLTEEESAKLAERAKEPGPEVAGGALSNLHLTYIVIALAAAVIVLVLK